MTTSSTGADLVLTLRDGRYAVTRTLAEGGQADTLEAVDKRDGRLVAIKRFRVKGASSWKDVELAEREARVLATISHPNLPVYIDHFEEEGCLYLVMVKMEGEPLSALIARGVHFPETEIIRLLHTASEALAYLHAQNPPIFHRDIKPGNIIRRPDGSFGIVDFGSVRENLKPEGGSTVVGTFGYMAPEQFQGRALPATDVYGLGATALTLLTKKAPESLPHRGLAIDVPTAVRGMASPPLVHALSAMLNPNPDERPSSLRMLLTALPIAGPQSFPASAAAPTPPNREADPIKENPSSPPMAVRSEAATVADELLGNPLVVAVVLIGLFAARIATWALFELFLATVLTVLAIVFRPLAGVAGDLAELGRSGRKALRQAARAVKDRSEATGRTRNRRPRVRVGESSARKTRVESDGTWQTRSEDEEPDDGTTRRRRRNRRR